MKHLIVLGIIGLMIGATPLKAAEPKADTVGLGWYSMSAPAGGRIWVSPIIGVDLGLGFADKNVLGAGKDRFHVNVGIPVNVAMTDNVNFFIRPGVELQTNARTVGTEVKSKMIITADLGVEWFVTDKFPLSAGHGLQFEQLSGQDDKFGVSALRALSFENVGCHFYFN
jgi:hypothetical protein